MGIFNFKKKYIQLFLISQLQIPKYKFKSLHWKPMFHEAVGQ